MQPSLQARQQLLNRVVESTSCSNSLCRQYRHMNCLLSRRARPSCQGLMLPARSKQRLQEQQQTCLRTMPPLWAFWPLCRTSTWHGPCSGHTGIMNWTCESA